MTQPAPKILLALLTFAIMTGAASTQQRRLYDAGGKDRLPVGDGQQWHDDELTIPEGASPAARRRPPTRRRSTMRPDA